MSEGAKRRASVLKIPEGRIRKSSGEKHEFWTHFFKDLHDSFLNM